MSRRGGEISKFAFLHPLVHYVKPIFAAETPSVHSAALAAAQGYLDAVLAENQTAAHKLSTEKTRILQICQAPQYEGRYCRILCEDLGPGGPIRRVGHHAILLEIEQALAELASEENLINLWRLTVAQPLHCLSQRQSYQVIYASVPSVVAEHSPARRIIQAAPPVSTASGPSPAATSKQRPINLTKKVAALHNQAENDAK